jgi:hypothetical protein
VVQDRISVVPVVAPSLAAADIDLPLCFAVVPLPVAAARIDGTLGVAVVPAPVA